MDDSESQRKLKASLKAKRAAKSKAKRAANDPEAILRDSRDASDSHRAWLKKSLRYSKDNLARWKEARNSESYKTTDPATKERIDSLLKDAREQVRRARKNLLEDYFSMWVGRAILWGVVLVPILAVIGFCTDTGPSREENIQNCISAAGSNCERACEADPTFLYCSTVYGEQVIGSGCVAEMNRLPSLERVEKCKRSACAAYTGETLDHCEKQYPR